MALTHCLSAVEISAHAAFDNAAIAGRCLVIYRQDSHIPQTQKLFSEVVNTE